MEGLDVFCCPSSGGIPLAGTQGCVYAGAVLLDNRDPKLEPAADRVSMSRKKRCPDSFSVNKTLIVSGETLRPIVCTWPKPGSHPATAYQNPQGLNSLAAGRLIASSATSPSREPGYRFLPRWVSPNALCLLFRTTNCVCRAGLHGEKNMRSALRSNKTRAIRCARTARSIYARFVLPIHV